MQRSVVTEFGMLIRHQRNPGRAIASFTIIVARPVCKRWAKTVETIHAERGSEGCDILPAIA